MKKGKVIICDDNGNTRKMALELFASAGFEVFAVSAKEAIGILDEHLIDIILLRISPNSKYEEVVSKLIHNTGRNPSLALIVASGIIKPSLREAISNLFDDVIFLIDPKKKEDFSGITDPRKN